MSEKNKNIKHEVDRLAKAVGLDIGGLKSLMDELAPDDAPSLNGKALSIYGNSTSKRSGYLSQNPEATYQSSKGAGSNVSYLIKDALFTLVTPTVNKGDKGLLELYINDAQVDSFDLAGVFNEAQRDGSQAYTPSNSSAGAITVYSVAKYNNFQAWQSLIVRLNLKPELLRKGYNTVVLKHINIGSDQTSSTFEVFYDDATTTPTVSVPALEIHSNNNEKWLSGVKYIGRNDQLKLSLVAQALYDNSYVSNPLYLSGLIGAPSASMNHTDSTASGVSSIPAAGEELSVTDKVITLSSSNQCTKDGRISVRPSDPFGSYATKTSASQKLLISTFGERATNTREYFDDEKYRLPLSWNWDDKDSGITGNWDSETALGANDSLQFVHSDNEHALMYPNVDLSNGFKPANAVDYSNQSGDKQYARCIKTSGKQSSIQVVLEGVTGGIGELGSGDINVELKLPTQTGWGDAAKPYNGIGVNDDGDGCLAGSISYSDGKATINATFGTRSSFGSNGRCYIRITHKNGNRVVKAISTNW